MSLNCRDIHTLPISRILIEKLVQNGFHDIHDLLITPIELARECNISHEIALNIIQTAESTMRSAQSNIANKVELTAKDILLKIGNSSNQRAIITFCKAIDQMLGGGVPIGQITEFCGVPGVGKTQIAMQLSLTVQIPFVFGGLGSECIYIDTEGSFMVERVYEMASEISNHLNKLAQRSQGKSSQENPSKTQESILNCITTAKEMTPERFLEGIHVFRIHDQTELIATINHLESFLKVKTKVRLIIIDSIAFHFRQELSDQSIRSRCLSNIAQTLNQLGYNYNLATVVVNHVTTRFERPVVTDTNYMTNHSANTSNSVQRLVPALGEQWSHCVTNRVMLYWHQGKQRMASLVKCPSMPCTAVKYCVCDKGIRDLVSNSVDNNDKKRKSIEDSDVLSNNTNTSTVHHPNNEYSSGTAGTSQYYEHQEYHFQQQQRQKYRQIQQQIPRR